LLHVVAYLIYIFLVSGQLVLLSTISEFLHSFCGQIWCTPCSSAKFHLMSIFFYPFYEGPDFTST